MRSYDDDGANVEATYVTLLTEMLQVVAKGGTLGLLSRLKGILKEGTIIDNLNHRKLYIALQEMSISSNRLHQALCQ